MIALQPFTAADFDHLISWITTEEILVQFSGKNFSFPLTVGQLEMYLKDVNRHVFKVLETTNNKVIGHCEYYIKEHVSKIGYVIIGNETNRGKGFGEQLIRELVNLSFKNNTVSLVELNVYDWNIAAIKCYEKVGFTINPAKKHVHEVNGNQWTAVNMIISKTDFEDSLVSFIK